MPFLWGLIDFLRTTCYHAFNVLRKCIGLNLFCYTCIHESFAFINQLTVYTLATYYFFLFMHEPFLLELVVLLLHWWISTTSKADLRMPRSWTLSVLDGWVLKMMGWWVTHNLCWRFLMKRMQHHFHINPSRVSRTPYPLWRKSFVWLCAFQIH
jgi:hypothetical protein